MSTRFDIGKYALLSDMHTSALVSLDGSIDWLTFPAFDSPSFFTKILGNDEHGFWSIRLKGCRSSERRYQPGTNILETIHISDAGSIKVLDFLAVGTSTRVLVRMVEVLQGNPTVHHELHLKKEYGLTPPSSILRGENSLRFQWSGVEIHLSANRESKGKEEFTLEQGESYVATLSYDQSVRTSGEELLKATTVSWRNWAKDFTYSGPHKDLVLRSALVLKALVYEPTGAILAAPTTSLPESIGGERNWDYRYCWLRDSVFTVRALSKIGYNEVGKSFFNWVLKTVAADQGILSVGYTIEGEKAREDETLDHLPGFANSRPVRIGNSGLHQFQLDVYGEFIICLHHCWKNGMIDFEGDLASLVESLLKKLLRVCDSPDQGIWEIRGEPKFYTYSQAMAWVGLDRGLRLARALDIDRIDTNEIQKKMDQIYERIFEQGINPKSGSFTQSLGSSGLDAANLRLSLVGFIDANSEIMRDTVDQTLACLHSRGGVLRYRSDDRLTGQEGYFLTCSYWLIENLALQGRLPEAKSILEETLSYSNDLHLQSEEISQDGMLLGNFPQAFSHIGLINALTAIQSAGG